MKPYFIITVFLFSLISVKAQKVERTGDFYNSTDIKTEGRVVVSNNKKGKLVIKLSPGFKTQEGPDLGVYLSTTEKVGDGEHVNVDNLFTLEGSQRYVSKEEIDIQTYDFIVIHCTKWNHWYGTAKLVDAVIDK